MGVDFNFISIRVFLQHLLWQQYAEDFSKRTDEFLVITDSHSIDVMLVLFDDVWSSVSQLGRQPEPKVSVHICCGVQSPRSTILRNLKRDYELDPYVMAILAARGDDRRVSIWDLYDKPDNHNGISYGRSGLKNKQGVSLSLLNFVLLWRRESIRISLQPRRLAIA